ncbi:MAG: hypothetical protein BA871_03700 [Desulfuromonadales bacterium C00003096]|nr:MAG: hypothetical protein BA871_03700 [Desulfuromonadales bacterium C00003096]
MGINKKGMIKMKRSVLLGITMMLLLTLPAASSDYTLDIFGNANEDDTINMQDVTYTELIILEYRDRTDLADAKYDGKINMQDVTQIELVILGKEKELTVLDSADRIVTVKKPVERIISLSSGCAEAIKAIGAKDQVVARNRDMDGVFFPELSKLSSVGSFFNPDYEKILELQPDIVTSYSAMTLEEKLEPAGIAVVCLHCYRPDKVEEEIKTLGYILDKRDGAEKFIDFFQSYLITINERVEGLSEEDMTQVYFEGYGDYSTCGKGSQEYQMTTMAGSINIAADLPGAGISGGVVDPEWLIEQNPAIIIKMAPRDLSCGYDEDNPAEMKAKREDIMSRPGFDRISAVKNDKVHLIARDIIPHPAFFVGVTYMAQWFYPELFEDMDPQAIHQEYLTEFQGLDYDLNEHGVFVYPRLGEV